MRPFVPLLLISTLSGFESFAADSATVVVLRGSAKNSAGAALREQQRLEPGTTVITGARSFVRLLFADNTQLNVGPDTTMKIENTKVGEASVVDLVGGQIRAKVTKDPLANHDGGPVREKMIVKTKTAAMGIRGTDFNVSFNPQNNITALITFEGSVAMTKLVEGASAQAALQAKSGVQAVGAGQFSGSQPELAQATIPVKISPAQLETLKGNADYTGFGDKAKKQDAMSSPVPPGVDPKSFSSGSEKALRETVAQSVGSAHLNTILSDSAAKDAPAPKATAPAEGSFNKATGEYAPRAGGFIDLASGRYVPPPAGSSFDANTGVFVPPRALGSFDPKTGNYAPPKGVDLDPVKGFVAEAKPAVSASGAAGAPDGVRTPSGAAPNPAASGTGSSPGGGAAALVVALNEGVKPENSTKTVTLDNSFSAGGAAAGGQFTQPPPPPPTTPPPPPPPNTDTVTDRPKSGNCADDNSCGGVAPAPAPTSSSVKFNVNVID